MPIFFDDHQYRVVEAACERLIPADGDPGATDAGVVDYIDRFLGAFTFDPPMIWAGGPFSGRFGGDAGFSSFHRLTAAQELAWRTRIEGSKGLVERERLGPVHGLQEQYADGIASLGADFADLSPAEQDKRLEAVPQFRKLLYDHACEGMYGPPEYGGNRGLVGWNYIGFAGDVQPRGYTDREVSEP